MVGAVGIQAFIFSTKKKTTKQTNTERARCHSCSQAEGESILRRTGRQQEVPIQPPRPSPYRAIPTKPVVRVDPEPELSCPL